MHIKEMAIDYIKLNILCLYDEKEATICYTRKPSKTMGLSWEKVPEK